jgi:alpha-L-rhamnosidase
VRVNGVAVSQAPGVTVKGMERGRLVLEIGSGDHRFEARA